MRRRTIMALFSVTLGVTACAYYDDYGYAGDGWQENGRAYGDYRYDGRDFGSERRDSDGSGFGGRGGSILDPWLALTPEGRQIVGSGFDGGSNGRISEETAHRANIWFRRYADHDRDMRLTDEEIRTALVHAARSSGRRPY